MQKILIIHSEEGNIEEIARGIAEGARKNGHQVDILSTRDRGRVVSFFPYDLILVGSPTRGISRGRLVKTYPPI